MRGLYPIGAVLSGFGLIYSWWRLLMFNDTPGVLLGALICMVGLIMILVSDRRVR